MHDVLDIIKNVQSLYSTGPTLDILKDFERVLDELDLYVYKNWEDGELVSGPNIKRHWIFKSATTQDANETAKAVVSSSAFTRRGSAHIKRNFNWCSEGGSAQCRITKR